MTIVFRFTIATSTHGLSVYRLDISDSIRVLQIYGEGHSSDVQRQCLKNINLTSFQSESCLC